VHGARTVWGSGNWVGLGDVYLGFIEQFYGYTDCGRHDCGFWLSAHEVERSSARLGIEEQFSAKSED
jgi:hypothetical protein